jgi:hypothetical protein
MKNAKIKFATVGISEIFHKERIFSLHNFLQIARFAIAATTD